MRCVRRHLDNHLRLVRSGQLAHPEHHAGVVGLLVLTCDAVRTSGNQMYR